MQHSISAHRPKRRAPHWTFLARLLALLALFFTAATLRAQVVINEIHYHPVENPAFTASGNPSLDLSDDVHEFVELYNAGADAVDLSGWKITGGIDFTVPVGTEIAAGGYKVLAKNPARLQTVYAITDVLGPYTGLLSNNSDTLKLKNASGDAVDSVTYFSSFPWPDTANALAADRDFTLIDASLYQYKGRSLERYSATSAGNDPANWLASPLASGPTPGRVNTSTGATPQPVVIARSAVQATGGAAIIRQNQPVRVTFTMSSLAALPAVPAFEVQYFADDVNSFTEVRSSVAATSTGNGTFTATLPGQLDRRVIRWRVRGNLGAGSP